MVNTPLVARRCIRSVTSCCLVMSPSVHDDGLAGGEETGEDVRAVVVRECVKAVPVRATGLVHDDPDDGTRIGFGGLRGRSRLRWMLHRFLLTARCRSASGGNEPGGSSPTRLEVWVVDVLRGSF
jgi:hypothetical protein